MKIGFTGIDIQEGKVKYQDPILTALTEKDKPKKTSCACFSYEENST